MQHKAGMDQPAAYRFFDPQTAMIFRAVAGCIVPSEPGSPGADSEAALLIADGALADRPANDRKLLATFLKVIEALPRLRYARPFTKLTPPQQRSVLAFLETNRLVPKLRQGFFGVKTFALLGFYGSESSFAELRYPGPRLDAPYYQVGKKKPVS